MPKLEQSSLVQSKIEQLRSIPVIAEVMKRLKEELSSDLAYHSFQHTEEVLAEVVSFATEDGLSASEVELLAIAAAFHDAGFLFRYQDNEVLGAELAEKAMRDVGIYSADDIAAVRQMILDTQLLNNGESYLKRPKTKLSRYLLDADLSNLGREDFFQKLELLQREFKLDSKRHLKNSLELLGNHSWLTPAAERLRTEQKALNIKRLKEMLSR